MKFYIEYEGSVTRPVEVAVVVVDGLYPLFSFHRIIKQPQTSNMDIKLRLYQHGLRMDIPHAVDFNQALYELHFLVQYYRPRKICTSHRALRRLLPAYRISVREFPNFKLRSQTSFFKMACALREKKSTTFNVLNVCDASNHTLWRCTSKNKDRGYQCAIITAFELAAVDSVCFPRSL
jgi:hypothetical protein